MKLLKQFLQEANYGSLINQDKYNDMDSADQALYKYTADGFTLLSRDEFKTLEERYPFEGGTLYRGLYFDDKGKLEAFLENVSDGEITMTGQSSWSTDRATAKDFAETVKTYFPTPEIMKADSDRRDAGDHMSGEGGGVLLKIENAPGGVGINVNLTEYAKESEVLLPAGTYKISIDQTLRPFRVTHPDVNKARGMIVNIEKFMRYGEGEKREIEKMVTYLEHSFLDELEDYEVDTVLQYRYGKALEMSPQEFAEKVVEVDTGRGDWRGTKDLYVTVNPYYNFNAFEFASEEMQDRIMQQVSEIPKVLAKELKPVENNIDEYVDFTFNGFEELAKFLPDATADATKGLKRALADMYNKLNSREHNKSLKDMDAIRNHAKRIGATVQAIAKLQ